jgi:hypothetical protein
MTSSRQSRLAGATIAAFTVAVAFAVILTMTIGHAGGIVTVSAIAMCVYVWRALGTAAAAVTVDPAMGSALHAVAVAPSLILAPIALLVGAGLNSTIETMAALALAAAPAVFAPAAFGSVAPTLAKWARGNHRARGGAAALASFAQRMSFIAGWPVVLTAITAAFRAASGSTISIGGLTAGDLIMITALCSFVFRLIYTCVSGWAYFVVIAIQEVVAVAGYVSSSETAHAIGAIAIATLLVEAEWQLATAVAANVLAGCVEVLYSADYDGQAPDRDGQAPDRDGQAPARDGLSPARDGQAPARDGQAPARDGLSPARDGQAPARDGQAPDHDCNPDTETTPLIAAHTVEVPEQPSLNGERMTSYDEFCV